MLFNTANNRVSGNSLAMNPNQFGSGIDIYYSNNDSILANHINNAPTPTSPWYFSAIKLRGAHGNDVEDNFGTGNGQPPVFETEGASDNTVVDNFGPGANPVPEPSSLALAAVAVVGLFGYAWRRRATLAA